MTLKHAIEKTMVAATRNKVQRENDRGETVDEMAEEQQYQELAGADHAGAPATCRRVSWLGHRCHRQPPARAPCLLVAQAEGDAEDEIEQDEHHAEAGDILLERRELQPLPGEAALLQLSSSSSPKGSPSDAASRSASRMMTLIACSSVHCAGSVSSSMVDGFSVR